MILSVGGAAGGRPSPAVARVRPDTKAALPPAQTQPCPAARRLTALPSYCLTFRRVLVSDKRRGSGVGGAECTPSVPAARAFRRGRPPPPRLAAPPGAVG